MLRLASPRDEKSNCIQESGSDPIKTCHFMRLTLSSFERLSLPRALAADCPTHLPLRVTLPERTLGVPDTALAASARECQGPREI
jgi:hypothetical protein